MKKLLLSFALLAIFALSALVRLPMMEEQVHIWQAGNIFMLTTLEIWHTEGINNSHYSPIQTWPNAGDKYMHTYKRLEDNEGNNYYVSHPPFTFQLAHAVFSITGSKPNQRVLKWLGLIFHFLAALGVFILVFFLSKNILSGVIAFAVCTFYPVLAYGFIFHYFSEIIGLSFWAVAMALFYWLTTLRTVTVWHWTLLGIINFLFVYTDWMGVFFTLSALAFVFISKPQDKRKYILALSLSMGLSLLLMFIQYSSIAGVCAFIHSMAIRFSERSGFFGETYSDQQLSLFNPASYKMLAEQFHHQLKWIGYFFVLLTVVFGVFMKGKSKENTAFKPLLFLMFIPALLHLVVFFNTNVIHYVYQAKWGIIIAILTGLMIGAIQNQTAKWVTTGLLVIAIVTSSIFLRNDIPKDSSEGKTIDMSSWIKASTKPHQAAFIQGLNPQYVHYLSYLSKRNILLVDDDNQALEIAQQLGKSECISYEVKDDQINRWETMRIRKH